MQGKGLAISETNCETLSHDNLSPSGHTPKKQHDL